MESILDWSAVTKFGQWLQTENVPHCLAALRHEMIYMGHERFKVHILATVCMMCGLRGGKSLAGLLWLNDSKGRMVIAAVMASSRASVVSGRKNAMLSSRTLSW